MHLTVTSSAYSLCLFYRIVSDVVAPSVTNWLIVRLTALIVLHDLLLFFLSLQAHSGWQTQSSSKISTPTSIKLAKHSKTCTKNFLLCHKPCRSDTCTGRGFPYCLRKALKDTSGPTKHDGPQHSNPRNPQVPTEGHPLPSRSHEGHW